MKKYEGKIKKCVETNMSPFTWAAGLGKFPDPSRWEGGGRKL